MRTWFRLALFIVVVSAVFLGSFDEWPGHLHLVFPRIGTLPIRGRVPRYMVQEVRVDCVGFVVLALHYVRRGLEPCFLQGAVLSDVGAKSWPSIERDDRSQVVIWCQIGRVLKRIEHGGCHQIELREGP